MANKVGMIGLGCAKNQVDAEIMLSELTKAGFEITPNADEADAVIVNTCGFIEDAKKESIEEILGMGLRKQQGKLKAVIVTGCLAERYKDEVSKEMPEVDAVVGIGGNAQIAQVVKDALAGKKTGLFPEKRSLPLNGSRVLTTPNYYAYLKVADGCDNRCTYCAIPLIRGGFRSRAMEDIIDEARELVASGVRELIVIAQDTTRYGEDLYGKLMLPELLKELCKIENLAWIRILYCYPDRLTDELIDVIAREDKILKYIDLPLQHCDERILKAMNRRGSRQSLTALIQKVRARIPGVTLRTTLIAGFPGEGEEEFNELAEFVKEIQFERLGCFAYSQEEDTPAAVMENQVDETVKQHRRDLIMESQSRIMERCSAALVGKTLRVLTEGFDSSLNLCYGRSAADSPDVDGRVYFTAETPVPPGTFAEVLIEDYEGCDLTGSLRAWEDEG